MLITFDELPFCRFVVLFELHTSQTITRDLYESFASDLRDAGKTLLLTKAYILVYTIDLKEPDVLALTLFPRF